MLSDRGRVRKQNEDACFLDVDQGLYVVSDGVGGQQGGAIASRLVVGLVPTLLERELRAERRPATAGDDQVAESLRHAVVNLNAEVRQRGIQHAGMQGLAATMVLAYLRGALAYIAHLGDSRAYLLRTGVLRRVTSDHTTANVLRRLGDQGATPGGGAGAPTTSVLAGALTVDPPARSQLARYVGMPGVAAPDVKSLPLQVGDRLLLCTDGLTGMLPERLLAHLLRRQPDPESACRLLVGAANESGGRDNVSVVAIYVDALPGRPLS